MSAFGGKKEIVASLQPLLDDPRYVSIDRERIAAFCSHLKARHFPFARWNHDFIYPALDESGLSYFLLFNALNFCYWGSPKWEVDYEGRKIDGAFGMLAALKKAIDGGIPILEGAFLEGIGPTDLAQILRGNVKIPLFEQRLVICREVGRVLVKSFGGHFHRVLEAAQGSAVKLVELLTAHFPSFDDSVLFGSHRLIFHKRAQLAPAMIHERWQGQGPGVFTDLGELTVSADYKLPQVLRKLGLLEYRNGLDRMVDESRTIPARSREENEIRAATIAVGEAMTEMLAPRLQGITSQRVDRLLWVVGQRKSPHDKPYHRTLTTAY
jgi:hypothetical protein